MTSHKRGGMSKKEGGSIDRGYVVGEFCKRENGRLVKHPKRKHFNLLKTKKQKEKQKKKER